MEMVIRYVPIKAQVEVRFRWPSGQVVRLDLTQSGKVWVATDLSWDKQPIPAEVADIESALSSLPLARVTAILANIRAAV